MPRPGCGGSIARFGIQKPWGSIGAAGVRDKARQWVGASISKCDNTAEVILWAVRWYLMFPISYRDLELMLQNRGVSVDHTTIFRCWCGRLPTASIVRDWGCRQTKETFAKYGEQLTATVLGRCQNLQENEQMVRSIDPRRGTLR
ncbi:MAG: transposase, family [Acetobacteraceae bacterium]|nr:transposase [Rhodopila sp.]MEA2769823.1 transposase, family [Acetobacteraceae bacterium]